MKLTLLSMLIVISLPSWSQTDHKQLEIEKVVPKERNCVEIPSSFSHETILESKSLNKLQSKKIKRVELIYTRFKENENLDQVQLNEDRMYRLNQLLPRLKNDHPEIVWIEQTGAKSSAEAANYFHGLRIYTDGESVKAIFTRISREDKSNPTSMFTVDNSVGGDFSHPSGTLINIPLDAVVYEDGKKVIGNYTISYREYRDPAEMAFSGIPMTYHDKTGDYQFNSAGMYEIRGTKDGKQLKLQKDIIVDFNCTKNETDINFYEMDDNSGQWTLLRSDLFAEPGSSQISQSTGVVPVGVSRSELQLTRGIAPDTEYPDNPQYSNIVNGLISSNFGVYNCDQIYRVANKISISPKFLDASTKKQIKDQSFVCLIDKAINASFTFPPKEITCNSQGENVFLLFTKDGKTYLIKSEKDKRMDLNSNEPEFIMEDITDQVKTSKDLKQLLSI